MGNGPSHPLTYSPRETMSGETAHDTWHFPFLCGKVYVKHLLVLPREKPQDYEEQASKL